MACTHGLDKKGNHIGLSVEHVLLYRLKRLCYNASLISTQNVCYIVTTLEGEKSRL